MGYEIDDWNQTFPGVQFLPSSTFFAQSGTGTTSGIFPCSFVFVFKISISLSDSFSASSFETFWKGNGLHTGDASLHFVIRFSICFSDSFNATSLDTFWKGSCGHWSLLFALVSFGVFPGQVPEDFELVSFFKHCLFTGDLDLRLSQGDIVLHSFSLPPFVCAFSPFECGLAPRSDMVR